MNGFSECGAIFNCTLTDDQGGIPFFLDVLGSNEMPSSSASRASQSRQFQANTGSDKESDDSFSPFETSARPREESTGSGILEALPLLRRPSIYLERRTSNASLGNGRAPTYGSDDGRSEDEAAGSLVRVQSGVKRVEAITLLWTKKSLIVAYVRYFIQGIR